MTAWYPLQIWFELQRLILRKKIESSLNLPGQVSNEYYLPENFPFTVFFANFSVIMIKATLNSPDKIFFMQHLINHNVFAIKPRKPLAMKTLRSISILICILLSGCVVNLQDTITGNGNVVKQKRDVAEFTGIRVSSGIDVFLTQGDLINLEVEADENLQEWIRTEVDGSVLKIYTDKNIRLAKTKKVYVTCKAIDRIDISSAGDVEGLTPFKSDKLDISLSSAGDLRFEAEAAEIDITISSAGNADLKGKTDVLKADLSSAGDLNAYELESKKADVSVSSAGNASVFVTEEASFRSSSAGSINYKGNPGIKEIHTSSAGSVNKK